jgi:ubiquitin carboxyl-terminal hydrolase 12/46
MGNEESSVILGRLGPHFPENVKFMKLDNLGNTCYANSLIQALLHSTYLTNFLDGIFRATARLRLSEEVKASLLFEFLSVFRSFQLSATREFEFRPKRFIQAIVDASPDFYIGAQHDSHELFMLLLSSFDETIRSLNSSFSLDLPAFSRLFSCHSTTTCECLMCGAVVRIHEDFTNFYLSVEARQSLVARLRSAQSPEYLHGAGKRFCRRCRIDQEMKIQCEYVTLPDVAVFQLQRFEVDYQTRRTRKVHQGIPFPSMLTINRTNYELRSIVVHIGSQLTSGHFVAILRIHERWILVNDSRISLLRNDQVEGFFSVGEDKNMCSTTAYLLFYEMLKE